MFLTPTLIITLADPLPQQRSRLDGFVRLLSSRYLELVDRQSPRRPCKFIRAIFGDARTKWKCQVKYSFLPGRDAGLSIRARKTVQTSATVEPRFGENFSTKQYLMLIESRLFTLPSRFVTVTSTE